MKVKYLIHSFVAFVFYAAFTPVHAAKVVAVNMSDKPLFVGTTAKDSPTDRHLREGGFINFSISGPFQFIVKKEKDEINPFKSSQITVSSQNQFFNIFPYASHTGFAIIDAHKTNVLIANNRTDKTFNITIDHGPDTLFPSQKILDKKEMSGTFYFDATLNKNYRITVSDEEGNTKTISYPNIFYRTIDITSDDAGNINISVTREQQKEE